MGLITRLQQKPEQVRTRIAFVAALFAVVCIVIVGIFLYKNPYTVDTGASVRNPVKDFQIFISEAEQDANLFVSPLEEQFLTQ